MVLAGIAIIGGLLTLLWSADRFVAGSAATAHHLGMPPLLIGMVVVGFGTSAPEMMVSALAAVAGKPGIALGNAYGSTICNSALTLGVSALVSPIMAQSNVVRKEIPILIAATALTTLLLADLYLSRLDAVILLVVFCGLLGWTIYQGIHNKTDSFGTEIAYEANATHMPMQQAAVWLALGLLLLLASSRVLVWGAVSLAQSFGVSDVFIGLTIVAIGTSLPELAASVSAARKQEHDIALGNVLGSNLFNILLVTGIAGAIHPLAVDPHILMRDIPMLGVLLLALLIMCSRFGSKKSRINRTEGALLLGAYFGYSTWLVYSTFAV